VESTGKQYIFFTNNSSKTSDFYIKKLEPMGLKIRPDQIMTSGDVTIKLFVA
jgi:4-nitrophenyl phosphatase